MSQNAMQPAPGATAIAKLRLAHGRSETALHNRLTVIGQGWRAPLAAYIDEAQQRFADQVASAGRRMVSGPLEARRTELAQLLADMKRQELLDVPPEMPLVVHIAVSLG